MSWTQGLNPEQAEAVLHNEGPLLILAGAGSGKTTVLVSRTGRLIAEGKALPSEMVVLTFTNKAARELKSRVANKVGDRAKGLWAGTFHSFGLKLLKQHHKLVGLSSTFGVIDQSDSQSIVKDIIKDIKVAGKDRFDVDKLLNIINDRRTFGRERVEGQDEYHELASVIMPKFVRRMELLGVVDFEGLLLKPIELFQNHPDVLKRVQDGMKYLMVDEFQDTNKTQMKLIDMLVNSSQNLAVVGDDDQSIYGWRGAQVSNILNFPKNFKSCRVIKLEKNYRSSSRILDLANEVISHNKDRHGKILKPHADGTGNLPELFVMDNEELEADFIGREIQNYFKQGRPYSEMAVLYRSNSQSGMIESVLKQMGIPYTVSGGTSLFDRKEVKDVLAYLRCAIRPNDVAFKRILNIPSRGLGDVSLEKINAWAAAKQTTFLKASKDFSSLGLQEKSLQGLMSFWEQLDLLPGFVMDPTSGHTPGRLLEEYFRKIGYRDYLFQTASDPLGADKKWILIEVIGRILDRFVLKTGVNRQTLEEFIEAMELRDEPDSDQDSKVSLMTLHACKGLEFPIVFLTGVEEDLLPHRTLGSDVSEERRLLYVGLTRAEEHLVLTRCRTRRRYGAPRPVAPSRFLLEVSAKNLRTFESGLRPVSGEERASLVSGFLSGLTQKMTDKSK